MTWADRRYEAPPGSIPTLPIPELAEMRRVHLVGIGGAGMSGIARLLLARGISVTGSDLKDSRLLHELRTTGAGVEVGHRAEHLPDDLDAVVVSTAIREGNPELAEARRRGLPVLARAQVLAALMKGARSIAVSGTHGKTTTTSMLAVILDRAGADPTYVIGGDLNEAGSGARPGGGDLFVAEADESDGSFLLLPAQVAVITNVEEDHLDFYRGGRAEIRAAFARFARSAETVVACGDDPGTVACLDDAGVDAVTYGRGPGNDAVLTAEEDGPLGPRGRLRMPDGTEVPLELLVRGRHNLLNASAAVLAAGVVGVPAGVAAEAVGAFQGARRRFEYRGLAAGAAFYDDYAHHPTEVLATLGAARSWLDHEMNGDGGRLVAVFQPHRYTRTEVMWRAMGESLRGADVVVITDVYAAGEEPLPGVTGKLLVDALAEAAPGKRLVYLPRRYDVVDFLSMEVRPGDLVLTLGAGDITMVAEETLDRIRGAA